MAALGTVERGRCARAHLGCIAEVVIPADAEIRIERAGRDPAHVTAWAAADVLLSLVVSVRRVEGVH